jgi:hypothetical protein
LLREPRPQQRRWRMRSRSAAQSPGQSAAFAPEAGNSPGVFMSSRGDLSGLITVFLFAFR